MVSGSKSKGAQTSRKTHFKLVACAKVFFWAVENAMVVTGKNKGATSAPLSLFCQEALMLSGLVIGHNSAG